MRPGFLWGFTAGYILSVTALVLCARALLLCVRGMVTLRGNLLLKAMVAYVLSICVFVASHVVVRVTGLWLFG